MGPKQTRHSPYAYDPDLPGNWTTAHLKQALTNHGITYSSNAKRSHLIRLVEENSINRPGSPLDTQRCAFPWCPVQNNNGGDHWVMIDLVSKLSSTIHNLQQNVINSFSPTDKYSCHIYALITADEYSHLGFPQQYGWWLYSSFYLYVKQAVITHENTNQWNTCLDAFVWSVLYLDAI